MNHYVEDIMGYGKKKLPLASAILFGAAAICFIQQINYQKKKKIWI